MPIVTLFNRAGSNPVGAAQSSGSVSGLYIAGFVVAGTICAGIALWLGIYLYRKRLARKRQGQMGAAFLSVRGLMQDGEPYLEKGVYSQNNPSSGSFSRNNINSQIILPSKALTKTSPNLEQAERDQIIAYHRQSGAFPKPFSFALQTSSSPTPQPNSGTERLSVVRNSYAPSSRTSRFSVFSAASSFNESLTSTATGGAERSIRRVRQAFNPVLPDELLVTVGEQLMILQSFDDGWCVAGRESGLLMPQPKSLFGFGRSSRTSTPTLFGHATGAGLGTTSGGNVELGMIPAWCFLKPVKGLRAERPVRGSSLGVTVQMDPPSGERNDLISWSNF